ncbi:MAG: acr1, partial [Geminicoccaceae bacterium]|nr:acr1 [Geminicoccaceae bacterium]
MKRAGRHRRKRLSAAPLLIMAGLSFMALRRVRERLGYSLQGRVVLITGSSRGLGLALAREMAQEGARLVITGRDPESLERAAASLASTGAEVLAIPADVTDAGSVADMIAAVRERYGHVDVLVNNAGVIEVGPAETMSVADYEEAMATNFWGMLYPTLALLPDMRARRSGRIVN